MSTMRRGALSKGWEAIAQRDRKLIVYGLAAAVVIVAATVSLLPFPTAVARIQDWTGLLRYTGPGEAPYGWINTTSFDIIKDDGQPVGQNISRDLMTAQMLFLFAEGPPAGMQLIAHDEGGYRMAPFQANASKLSILFLDPSNFSYFASTYCNYKITVQGSAFLHMHPLTIPGGGYYEYPVFTANTSRSGAPINSLFENFPAAAQSSVTLSGRGIALTTDGATTNLTGIATLAITGFSRAGLSVSGYSQTYTLHEGSRIVFDSGSFDLRNLNGTIESPQAGEIPLHNATVKIGSTTSAVFQMAYPLTYGTQSSTMDIQLRGAIINLAETGQPAYPGADMVETTSITYVRAITIGIMTFFGGFFLDRAHRDA